VPITLRTGSERWSNSASRGGRILARPVVMAATGFLEVGQQRYAYRRFGDGAGTGPTEITAVVD
jgi:hypothetical protein